MGNVGNELSQQEVKGRRLVNFYVPIITYLVI